MPRLSKEEIVGLKLINHLVDYQVYVGLVCDPLEAAWYREIGTHVRQHVEEAEQLFGLEAEGLIHAILWELECRFKQKYRDVSFTKEKYGRDDNQREKAKKITDIILKKMPPARPIPWFRNLNEKVLLAEQYDAPAKVLAWLAKAEILNPGKYKGLVQDYGRQDTDIRKRQVDQNLCAYRAVLLLQAENWRAVERAKHDDYGTLFLDKLSAQKGDLAVVTQTLLNTPYLPRHEVANIMVRVQNAIRGKDSQRNDRALLAIEPKWFKHNDWSSLREYFGDLRRILSDGEGFIKTKAKAVSILAAVMVLIREKSGEKIPRYSPTNEDETTTGKVSSAFESLGFKVEARTINSHLPRSEESDLLTCLKHMRKHYQRSKQVERRSLPRFSQLTPEELEASAAPIEQHTPAAITALGCSADVGQATLMITPSNPSTNK